MCPLCISTAALIAIGATGTGGLTLLAVKSLGKRQATNTIPEQSKPQEDHHG